MDPIFNFGTIFYKVTEAWETHYIQSKTNVNLNVYAFEFDNTGKRGYFLADYDKIVRVLKHQLGSPKKMCIYEVKFIL